MRSATHIVGHTSARREQPVHDDSIARRCTMITGEMSVAERAARATLTTLLLLYGVDLLWHPGFAMIDNVNLPIHEAGHLVFAPFGEFVTALGGSLLQVIFPAVFVVYFMRRNDEHSASVALWWVAQNLWNVSIYIADAQEQELPLVGGGEHDWAYLLAEMGILRRDDQVAAMVRFVGTMLFLVAIGWGYRSLRPRGSASTGRDLASET